MTLALLYRGFCGVVVTKGAQVAFGSGKGSQIHEGADQGEQAAQAAATVGHKVGTPSVPARAFACCEDAMLFAIVQLSRRMAKRVYAGESHYDERLVLIGVGSCAGVGD